MSGGWTPGPWRIDDERDARPVIVGRPTWPCNRFGVQGEWEVARLDWTVAEDHAAETASNARLIAAAPDLAEACQAFVDRFDSGSRADTDYVAGLMRAALAKATTL